MIRLSFSSADKPHIVHAIRQYIANYLPQLRDTLWLVVLQGVNYLLPLVVWPYLMVTLCADGFGRLGLAMSLAQFMMLVVDFGFNLSATKQVALHAEDRNRLGRIVSSTLRAKGWLLTACAVLLLGMLCIPQYAPYYSMCLISFGMVIGNTFTFQWLFQGLGKIRIVSLVNCLSRILILPLTFLFVHSPEDAELAIAIQSGTYLLSGAIMCLLTYRLHLPLMWCDRNQTRAALRGSLPIFISTAATSIYTMLLVLVLGYVCSADEVGQYTATEKLARVSAYVLLLPVFQSFFPRISRLAADTPAQARLTARYVTGAMVLYGVLLGGIIWFMAGPILAFLGKGYQHNEPLFHLMSVLPMLLAVSGGCSQLGLVAQGGEQQKKQFRNIYLLSAVAALLVIGLCYTHLTAYYTAMALIVAEAVAAVGMGVSYYRFLHT